jgi:hypothetical protein
MHGPRVDSRGIRPHPTARRDGGCPLEDLALVRLLDRGYPKLSL